MSSKQQDQSQKDQVVASIASRARSASIDLNSMAMELETIITTLPTTQDQALFKETTLSKPLRYIKAGGGGVLPLPILTKKEKQIELNGITIENLNLMRLWNKDPKRANVTVIMSQFLQCLLWDFGFRFTLLPHQFEAVFAVAGMKTTVLLEEMMTWDDRKLNMLIKIDPRKEEGKTMRKEVCKEYVSFTRSKGLLLADCMGLGKTVESLAATLLRDRIYAIKIESKEQSNGADLKKYILPSLIIAPNEAVLHQWEESLIMSGIDLERIKYFNCFDKNLLQYEQDYILMTRHELMTEVRKLFKGEHCVIFPSIPKETVDGLQDIVGKNEKGYGEAVKTAQITKILSANMKLVNWRCFRSLVIDEAHMMKNLATYWGVGAGLLSALSQRNIPLSGTPFIHGTQDMATLMVYINSTLPQAQKYWWTGATSPYNPGEETVNDVKQWRRNYFVRRKKSVLLKELPLKTISVKDVGCLGSELTVYKEHENAFFDALNAFKKMSEGKIEDKGGFDDKRELVNFLFAQLTCMRMSTIHPLLTKGREFTIKFSPSRRNNPQAIAKVCVCCKMGAIRRKDGSPDDAESQFISVPSNLCHVANTSCPHNIHVKCLKLLEAEGNDHCPRCKEFENLAQVDPKLAYKIPYPTYSKSVFVANDVNGFKATSKIQKVVEWVKDIPEGDKAIVYSFFEGSLDLLEGIFTENLNIECARFDDDVDSETQAVELARFKNSPTCNLLLATVQSSGTGLNIEEANHIAFLDRCFDTSIHRQAEDRCHNLRQKKEVEVTYFDSSMTVDEIMRTLNVQTSTNDTVRLIDGTEVGKKEPTIKYDNLNREISRMLKAVQKERQTYLEKNPENALTPSKTDLMKASKEKENVPLSTNGNVVQPSTTKPQALSDASNRDRRVSFAATIGSNQQQPVMTPRQTHSAKVFQTPSAFNYLTAMQSPYSPSFNYSAYHGYGTSIPYTNQAAHALPGFYTYPTVPSSPGFQTAIPVYGNNQSTTPTRQYSNIVNSKKQRRTKRK